MIKELSVNFEVKECCEALRVSRSGFYRWQEAEPSRREKENAQLVEQIKADKEGLCSQQEPLWQPSGDQGTAPAGFAVRGKAHRSLNAAKQTGRSCQEGVSAPDNGRRQ